MARVIRSATKVRNALKAVKMEVARWENAATTAGQEQAMLLVGGTGIGSPGQEFTVPIAEAAELISFGITDFLETGMPGQTKFLRFTDKNLTEWNRFYTRAPILPSGPIASTTTNGRNAYVQRNELPIVNPWNFERECMSWGFRSLLSSPTQLAPTWKLPEGDLLRPMLNAITTGEGFAAMLAGDYNAIGLVRRYKAESGVDFRHFNQWDGGLKSFRHYYNDWQEKGHNGTDAYLVDGVGAYTNANYTKAWTQTLIRNEAYKYFTVGHVPGYHHGAAHPADSGVNIVDFASAVGRINIDHPRVEVNTYFTGVHTNQLPLVKMDEFYNYVPDSDGGGAETAPWAYQSYQGNPERFSPTVDVVKNHNKSLDFFVQPSGSAALGRTSTVTRFRGIKMLL